MSLMENIPSVQDYHIILSTRNMTHLGEIQNIDQESISINENFNSANELSFTVYKQLGEQKCKLWDKIVDLKLVYIAERNEYFQIECPITDSDATYKVVTGTSLCEAELGQINLNGVYINTEEDIARDDYIPTIFCDPTKPAGSLLHRVLKSAPHYTIGHVDDSLKNLQRTFSIDGASIYDFFTGDCAEQFNCIFLFDTPTRTINVYDLYTVCNKCGYRGEYNDVCPKCGNDDLKYYGEDTTIAVSKDNLTDEISYSTDVDSIKNYFKLTAGDDDMTAAVINNNPAGTAYITVISDFQKEDMSTELIDRLNSYEALYQEKQPEYSKLTEGLYEAIDKIGYYTSSMMPEGKPQEEITAAKQAANLTEKNLSPLCLLNVTSSTSIATVESALKNYAKVYVKSAYVKLEIVDGINYKKEFSYEGEDDDGNHYGYWKGRIKVTNYSNEEDVAYTDDLNLKVYDMYEDFLKQKIAKVIDKENDDEGSIYDVLTIKSYKSDGKTEDNDKTLERFKKALTYYSLNRLKAFYEAVQSCIDIMVQEDQASEMADLYNVMYVPYKNKLDAVQKEMDKRQATIDEWQTRYDSLDKQRIEMQKELNFEEYLGDELFLEFSAYRRDDTYSNDNYISDGLDNAELFKKANEFLEAAKKEIKKASEPQHTISASLYNLLKIKAFEPLVDHFKIGNWIRFIVDDKVYRLRLVKIGYDNSDSTKLTTEFSNLTVTPDIQTDVQSILSSAQSMSSSYSYVAKQAEQGEKAKAALSEMEQQGLNSALYNIINADDQQVVYDKHGLLCRKYDDITGVYDPSQFRITANCMAFTYDNWRTIITAIGKQKYKLNGITYEDYGVNTRFLISGLIISGNIYSKNYKTNDQGVITNGTHINLETGDFDFAGGKLHYSSEDDVLEMTGHMKAGLIEGSRFEGGSLLIGKKESNNYAEIDENGKMIARGVTIIDGTFESATTGTTYVGVNIKNSDITGSSFSSSNGTHTVYTEILDDGEFASKGGTFDGEINTTSGTIAGMNIELNGIHSDNDSKSSGISSEAKNVFWAGTTYNSRAIAPFRISDDGTVFAKDIRVEDNSKNTSFSIINSKITGTNNSNFETVSISNLDGNITLYDSKSENPLTLSSEEINLSDPNSQLIVGGTKSRVSKTENYNDRLLYCYETPSPMFGDIGSATVDDTGECIIYIDPVFEETINTNNCNYYVFLTPYGKGELYVSDIQADYFIVSGTSGLNFSWEIKAKQKNYESLRLEENMAKVSADYTDEELLLSDIDKWTNSIIEEALNYE